MSAAGIITSTLDGFLSKKKNNIAYHVVDLINADEAGGKLELVVISSQYLH